MAGSSGALLGVQDTAGINLVLEPGQERLGPRPRARRRIGGPQRPGVWAATCAAIRHDAGTDL